MIFLLGWHPKRLSSSHKFVKELQNSEKKIRRQTLFVVPKELQDSRGVYMVSFYAAVSPLLLISCLNYISGCEMNTVEDSYSLENIRRDIRCFGDDEVCSDVDGFEKACVC